MRKLYFGTAILCIAFFAAWAVDVVKARENSTKTISCDVSFVYAMEPTGKPPKGFNGSRYVDSAEIGCDGNRALYAQRKDFGGLDRADWDSLQVGDQLICKFVEPKFSGSYVYACKKT